MHRQPDHVLTFLLAGMGTNGSLDGQQRLVVKGRFASKNFEGILRRYISIYFNFEGGRIMQCGSGRSVAPIKTGFLLKSRPAGS
ncbi:eukaryotic translation initiation factor 2 subunit beta-like protein [Tanacetum coccineum]